VNDLSLMSVVDRRHALSLVGLVRSPYPSRAGRRASIVSSMGVFEAMDLAQVDVVGYRAW
jgi:hypothetical protein